MDEGSDSSSDDQDSITAPDESSMTVDVLEELSATELNDRLLGLSAFHCRKCSARLTHPIMIVKDVGNVCKKCLIQFDIKTAIHNSSLELVLNNLIVPCSNITKGCKHKQNFFNILKHEKYCGYRRTHCPLKLLESCTWQGDLTNLHKHFVEQHRSMVQSNKDDEYEFFVDATKTSETMKLLSDEKDIFILHTKCDSEELQVMFNVYYIKKEEDGLDFIYSIEVTNPEYGSECNLDNVVSQRVIVPVRFDNSRCLKIDLSSMKPHIVKGQPAINFLIKIGEDDQNTQKSSERLLKAFECPTCDSFMTPPIVLCVNGHSVCNRCKAKSKQCPTCKEDYSKARNYALEHFSGDVLFPCVYRSQGCNTVLQDAEIVQHELDCPLQYFRCPISETCQTKCDFYGVSDHLVKVHTDVQVVYGNYNLRQIDLKKTTDLTFYMIYDERLFRIYGAFDADEYFCWFVQLFGPRPDAKAYKFEVGFIDKTIVDKKYIQSRLCVDWTNIPVQAHSQGVTIPLRILSSFSQDDKYVVYCKISKVVETAQRKALIAWISTEKSKST